MRKLVILGCAVALLVGASFGVVAQNNDAFIPGLASFVIPGLGQVLNDQIDKAILHFGVAIALDVGMYYIAGLLPLGYYSYPLVGLVHLGWAVYSGLDAYNVAKEQGFRLGFVENGIGFQFNF